MARQEYRVLQSEQEDMFILIHSERDLLQLLDKAGLPSMHIHDLRHTASTLMQGLGVSPKAVQEMLGHSQLTQTGDYTHVILSMQQQASERMDILFQKPS